MTVKAIAWDIDGTLIDSEPLHHRSFVAGSLALGKDFSGMPENRFRGVHMNDVWEAVRDELPAGTDKRDWLRAIQGCYARDAAGLAAMPGAVEAFAAVAALGLKQVCVSNSDRAIVDANIAALGIAHGIAFSLAINDVARGKPDPEPYLAAARRLGLKPAEMIAVEDSATGARSARDAGMIVVGYHQERVRFADLDHVIADHAEFVTLVRQLSTVPA